MVKNIVAGLRAADPWPPRGRQQPGGARYPFSPDLSNPDVSAAGFASQCFPAEPMKQHERDRGRQDEAGGLRAADAHFVACSSGECRFGRDEVLLSSEHSAAGLGLAWHLMGGLDHGHTLRALLSRRARATLPSAEETLSSLTQAGTIS